MPRYFFRGSLYDEVKDKVYTYKVDTENYDNDIINFSTTLKDITQ